MASDGHLPSREPQILTEKTAQSLLFRKFTRKLVKTKEIGFVSA